MTPSKKGNDLWISLELKLLHIPLQIDVEPQTTGWWRKTILRVQLCFWYCMTNGLIWCTQDSSTSFDRKQDRLKRSLLARGSRPPESSLNLLPPERHHKQTLAALRKPMPTCIQDLEVDLIELGTIGVFHTFQPGMIAFMVAPIPAPFCQEALGTLFWSIRKIIPRATCKEWRNNFLSENQQLLPLPVRWWLQTGCKLGLWTSNCVQVQPLRTQKLVHPPDEKQFPQLLVPDHPRHLLQKYRSWLLHLDVIKACSIAFCPGIFLNWGWIQLVLWVYPFPVTMDANPNNKVEPVTGIFNGTGWHPTNSLNESNHVIQWMRFSKNKNKDNPVQVPALSSFQLSSPVDRATQRRKDPPWASWKCHASRHPQQG